MTGTTVVVGPRTRAGQAVLRRAADRGDALVVVARHDRDADALASGDVTVLRADRDLDLDLLREDVGPVRIAICALGPVHPDEARAVDDGAAFLRDLDCLERLLAATACRQVSVVLISTVIALAPGEDRRYYGGWKCLVEQQLAETIDRLVPHAGLSVVYPGRLVEGPARRALPGLHTTYARLAATVDALADRPGSSRVAGIDARLWMAVRGLRLAAASLRPAAQRPTAQLPTARISTARISTAPTPSERFSPS